MGQIIDNKVQKDQKPSATSEVPGAKKAGYWAWSYYTAPQGVRWTAEATCSGPTHWSAATSPIQEPTHPPMGSEQGHLWLVLTSLAAAVLYVCESLSRAPTLSTPWTAIPRFLCPWVFQARIIEAIYSQESYLTRSNSSPALQADSYQPLTQQRTLWSPQNLARMSHLTSSQLPLMKSPQTQVNNSLSDILSFVPEMPDIELSIPQTGRIHFCCSKPPSLWLFVMVATGNSWRVLGRKDSFSRRVSFGRQRKNRARGACGGDLIRTCHFNTTPLPLFFDHSLCSMKSSAHFFFSVVSSAPDWLLDPALSLAKILVLHFPVTCTWKIRFKWSFDLSLDFLEASWVLHLEVTLYVLPSTLGLLVVEFHLSPISTITWLWTYPWRLYCTEKILCIACKGHS